jgi:hypothetical protein
MWRCLYWISLSLGLAPLYTTISASSCTLPGLVEGQYRLMWDHQEIDLFYISHSDSPDVSDTVHGYCSDLRRGNDRCDLTHFIGAAVAIQLCASQDNLKSINDNIIARMEANSTKSSQETLTLSNAIDALTYRIDNLITSAK